MLNCVMRLSVIALICVWVAAPVESASIPIKNHSFESPVVPLDWLALPSIDGWTEIDIAPLGDSVNTGVFPNTEPNSVDHIVNADGKQLAFLFSQQGNALQQDLEAVYKVGCDYRLTVALCVSDWAPASDPLELVLYYRDADDPNNLVDIATKAVEPTGLSSTWLEDFSVYLPRVDSSDAWAGKPIGLAIRASGAPDVAGGVWDLDNVRLVESLPVLIAIENASFESPVVDPNGFGVSTDVEGWIEIDLDLLGSQNTGVFVNPEPNHISPFAGVHDRILNADGSQLALLCSQQGNALEQDLSAKYRVGCDYRLTVAVGVSLLSPSEPLKLVLYYRDGNEAVDIASLTIPAMLWSQQLEDFSLYLPAVSSSDAWAGKTIGIAIRATGAAGGFWDLDNVRLGESLPAKDKK